MKISSNRPGPMPTSTPSTDASKSSAAATGLGAAVDAKAPKTTSTADLASASKVELSSRAQDIKKAKELATPSEGIDEAKVARLQAMIDAGKYKVNAEAVADRLLDEHTKMPS
ncbi:MAG TPA: flagellar biosynthesis anti-sigma factor FlgM [Bdellovibrionales bacterium]|jgi:negative regulator of flagellin synthesis FlgM|nr:flagellar biosynthesis anti-sigma factor FlgM [Bdellovibrionales bacterium]